MAGILKRVLGDPQAKTVKRLKKKVEEINSYTDVIGKLSDSALKAKTKEFKDRLDKGEKIDALLPEAFAVSREAADRVLKQRPYDVQLMGGIVLHEGSVTEMKTGEGKTLMETLPVYLNALVGKGVHVVTVNDYLASRDAGWMGQLYDFLGLSVGVITGNDTFVYDSSYKNSDHDDPRMQHLKPAERKDAYAADVTYGTNNEFGFDYLRDNMVRDIDQLRQRPLHYAIVDEVDSILIDEARTPLIISAPASASASSYSTFAKVVRQLNTDDYEIDEKRKAVSLNDDGVNKIEKALGVDNLYAPENVRLIYHLDQALRAETLFKREKEYVVNADGEVVIVDEFTGRLMHGRRYNEGLHQAIEAKEGVEVLQESMTLATISFQNYFRLYEKLSGMTGTAMTESEEFYQIYKLDVVEIPTNKPSIRQDKADKIYRTEKAKFNAIVEEVKRITDGGQPVLIGTASIEKNELLSRLLTKAGIKHNVLNAKHHEEEAAIVAKAGEAGTVTLATNIAGRGTDIVLGKGVVKAGGLFVLGSERHESRRIDNQLRGRAGRQGDPGTTQFFVSAEDDLMRIFGGERIAKLMDRLGVDENVPIENRTLSKALETAQKKVESFHFDSRKNVVEYDDVMNRHRKSVYRLRQEILAAESIEDSIKELVDAYIEQFTPGEKDKLNELAKELQTTFNFSDSVTKKLGELKKDEFIAGVKKKALAEYKSREKEFTPEILRRLEREVYLQVLDNLWMQHLESMGHLREGINWRSVGQKDPLVEYRREGQIMFEEMQVTMREETLKTLFNAVKEVAAQTDAVIETEITRAAQQSTEQGASESGGTTVRSKNKTKITRESAPVNEKSEKRKKREAQKKKKSKRKKGRK